MSLVESAYRFDQPEADWLEGLVEAARPLLDDGNGVMGFIADLSAPDPLRSPAGSGGSPEWRATWRRGWWESALLPVPREALSSMFSFGPVAYASQVGDAMAQRFEVFEDYFAAVRDAGLQSAFGRTFGVERDLDGAVSYPEAVAIIATEATGHSVILCGNRAANATRLPSRALINRWGRVAAHLSAAHRMRRRLAGGSPLEGAEAVMTPRGRVLHAEGRAQDPAAREALRDAVVALDRARTAEVRETDEALEMWRALQEGRWSLVDAFDRDGRRFVVARPNEPAALPAPSLSNREQQVLDLLALGHSNKLIAYDLGISTSSVATHLRRAADKIGLRTTRELVRWARARRRPTDA